MEAIGMAIFALGFIGLVYGIMQKMRAARVGAAPFVKTGELASQGAKVAGPRGEISVEGDVVCSAPLTSPVTGVSCLYYELKTTAMWKDGDTQKSKQLEHRKVAADFTVDDGTGPVRIDARDGGDFEPSQKREETKGGGLLGGITGKEIQFGNYTISPGALSLGTKYEVVETVFPVEKRIYACGKVADRGGITAPGFRQLILSNKSRDEILSKATQGAKTFLMAGSGVLVVGLGLAIAGHFMASPEPVASAATAKPSAETAAKAPDPQPAPAATAPDAPAATGATDSSAGAKRGGKHDKDGKDGREGKDGKGKDKEAKHDGKEGKGEGKDGKGKGHKK